MNLTQFTRQSSITKSLQFKMEPVGKTMDTIRNSKYIEEDSRLLDVLNRVSPYINMVLQQIIDKALDNIDFDFNALYESASAATSAENDEKKDRNRQKKLEDQLKKTVTESIKKNLPSDKRFRKSLKGINDINSAEFIDDMVPILIEDMADLDENSKAEALDLISQIHGKQPLLTRYLTSRVTTLNTWVPDRVVENFWRYAGNIPKAKEILAEDDFSSILNDYPEFVSFAQPSYYSQFMTQGGIDGYNEILSGIIEENGIIKKGINGIINEYNQTEGKKQDKKTYPILQPLYKQILMPGKKAFSIECITTDDEVRDVLKNISIDMVRPLVLDVMGNSVKAGDLAVRGINVHQLSHIVTGEHSIITDRMIKEKQEAYMSARKNKTKALSKKEEKEYALIPEKNRKQEYTFAELEKYEPDVTDVYKYALFDSYSLLEGAQEEINGLIKSDDTVRYNSVSTAKVIDYFNAWTDLKDMLHIISRKTDEKGDNVFYNTYEETMESLRAVSKANNLVRNYMTMTPGEQAKKIETVFGAVSRKASTWWKKDTPFEKNNMMITRENGIYYYYILAADYRGSFSPEGSDTDCMLYSITKVQDANKQCPKMTFTAAKKYFAKHPDADSFTVTQNVTEPVKITREVYDLYENGAHTRAAVNDGRVTEEEYRKAVPMVISVLDRFARNYHVFDAFDIRTKDVKLYDTVKEYYDDLQMCLLPKTEWVPGDMAKLDKMVEDGKLLKFRLNAQNMYPKHEGVHQSSYVKLFLYALSEDNDGNVVLNSRPTAFYRAKSIKDADRTIHKSGSVLVGRYDLNGEHIPDDAYRQIKDFYNDRLSRGEQYDFQQSAAYKKYITGHLVNTKKFRTDIIKDKRYTEDQFMIQFSYKKNASAVNGMTRAERNGVFREALNSGCNVVSLVRNTQDLIYMSVIDKDGNVLEEKSLNRISTMDRNGHVRTIDYYARLTEMGDMRNESKALEWKYDRKIKNFKDDFIKAAISEIVRTVVKYDAVIAVEAISDRVKDRFSALDNTVFKSFEAKLITRLSDLFFNDVPEGEPGSQTNPYQLADPSDSSAFQNGIVFFTGTGYLRSRDPETGYAPLFRLGQIKSAGAEKAFFSKFESIKADKGLMEMKFNYDNFNTSCMTDRTDWTIHIGGEATEYDREKKCNKFIPCTMELIEKSMDESGIENTADLAELARKGELPTTVADTLFRYFKNQMYGNVKKHDDKRETYISPVNGKKYDMSSMSAGNLADKTRWFYSPDRKKDDGWLDNIAG